VLEPRGVGNSFEETAVSKPELQAKFAAHRDTFPKTTKAFDWLQYVAHRLEETVWQSKYLLFGLGFLLFLIYELAHFAKFLVKNWTG
jgi:hypothetical protein